MTEPLFCISPPNTLLRINVVWMVISEDETGCEGVCAAPLLGPGSIIPLIAADEKRLADITEWARRLKQVRPASHKIRLIKLSQREDIMEIE